MSENYYYIQVIILIYYIQITECIPVQYYESLVNKEPENDLAKFIVSKGYLPDNKKLPTSVVTRYDNDEGYILSKLSDEELINLLNSDPKKESFDLNDIVQTALGDKYFKTFKARQDEIGEKRSYSKNINEDALQTSSDITTDSSAVFKLNHKRVLSDKQKSIVNFFALKKLQNLLYRTQSGSEIENLTDQKRELLFDMLVAQLKLLCCKNPSKLKLFGSQSLFLNNLLSDISDQQKLQENTKNKNNEVMFLILNEEIKGKDEDDLILVDPETLNKNSSVLLLGPLKTPLTDKQLKTVMNRVSNELMKPEYISFMQKLSKGTLSQDDSSVLKNLITGPDTRRYIKAHRCNHQSKLSKIYGGPKWLICTGYLNINTPSLYD